MPQYDGQIIINSELDVEGVKKGFQDLQKSSDTWARSTEKDFDAVKRSSQDLQSYMQNLDKNIAQMTGNMKEYNRIDLAQNLKRITIEMKAQGATAAQTGEALKRYVAAQKQGISISGRHVKAIALLTRHLTGLKMAAGAAAASLPLMAISAVVGIVMKLASSQNDGEKIADKYNDTVAGLKGSADQSANAIKNLEDRISNLAAVQLQVETKDAQKGLDELRKDMDDLVKPDWGHEYGKQLERATNFKAITAELYSGKITTDEFIEKISKLGEGMDEAGQKMADSLIKKIPEFKTFSLTLELATKHLDEFGKASMQTDALAKALNKIGEVKGPEDAANAIYRLTDNTEQAAKRTELLARAQLSSAIATLEGAKAAEIARKAIYEKMLAEAVATANLAKQGLALAALGQSNKNLADIQAVLTQGQKAFNSGMQLTGKTAEAAAKATAALAKEIENMGRTEPETRQLAFNRALEGFKQKAIDAKVSGDALIKMCEDFKVAWDAKTEKDLANAMQDLNKEMANLSGNMQEVKRIDIAQSMQTWRDKLSPLISDTEELEQVLGQLQARMEKKASAETISASLQDAVGFLKDMGSVIGDQNVLFKYQSQLIDQIAEKYRTELPESLQPMIDKWAEFQKLQADPSFEAGIKRSALVFVDEWTDAGKVAEKQFGAIMDTVQGIGNTAIDAIFGDAEFRLDKFFKDLTKQLMQIAMNQMFAKIIGSFASAHTGGIVGAPDGNPVRRVHPFAFMGAPRYHAGGIAGLRSNEVPTILQRGEGIFTQAQMRALGAGLQRGQAPVNNINVITPPGARAQTQESQNASGGMDTTILIELVDNAIAGGINSRRSHTYKALQGMT